MTDQDPVQERIDKAAAQLLIALAFLLPKGNDLEASVGRHLVEYADAIKGTLAVEDNLRERLKIAEQTRDGCQQASTRDLLAKRAAEEERDALRQLWEHNGMRRCLCEPCEAARALLASRQP